MNALHLRKTEVRHTKKLEDGLNWLIQLGLKTKEISCTKLRKFICQERTPAGAVLRSCLDTVSGYQVGFNCKSYKLNPTKLFQLCKKYKGIELPTCLTSDANKVLYLKHEQKNPFLKTVPRDEMHRSGNRYYSTHCFLPQEVRAALIEHGWDYDIAASMATLLYQLYEKTGGIELPMWRLLVENKSKFRNELSNFSGLKQEDIKAIIAAILNGAQLNRHKTQAVFKIWREGRANISFEELAAHPYLVGLVKEGRDLYKCLIPLEDRLKKEIKRNGEVKLRVRSRGYHQYKLYELIENQVMSILARELGNQVGWFIHDGFMTKIRISEVILRAALLALTKETGFSIKLEETELISNKTEKNIENKSAINQVNPINGSPGIICCYFSGMTIVLNPVFKILRQITNYYYNIKLQI